MSKKEQISVFDHLKDSEEWSTDIEKIWEGMV